VWSEIKTPADAVAQNPAHHGAASGVARSINTLRALSSVPSMPKDG
jgi:hypothetical protein